MRVYNGHLVPVGDIHKHFALAIGDGILRRAAQVDCGVRFGALEVHVWCDRNHPMSVAAQDQYAAASRVIDDGVGVRCRSDLSQSRAGLQVKDDHRAVLSVADEPAASLGHESDAMGP